MHFFIQFHLLKNFTHDTLQHEEDSLISFRNNEKRQSQILESFAAAVYTCDVDGYIKFYNKSAANLWGREPEIDKDLWCGSWKIYEPDGITPLPLDSCPMAQKAQKTPYRNRYFFAARCR